MRDKKDLSYNLYEPIFASNNHFGLIWHILNKRSVYETEIYIHIYIYIYTYTIYIYA